MEDGGMTEAARCNTSEQIIIVVSGNKQAQASGILHEILEALRYHLEMPLDHQTLMSLEAGLFQALNDNGVNVLALLDGLEA